MNPASRSEDLLADKWLAEKRIRQGRTLIVGSKLYIGREDRRKRYAEAVGVDMQRGKGVDVVCNLEGPCELGTFAHMECCSVLEHSKKPWKLAANLERMLEKRGTMFLRVPWVWRFHGYPSDYWRFTPEAVRVLFPNMQWDLVVLTETAITHKLPKYNVDGKRAFGRAEVMGFGWKC